MSHLSNRQVLEKYRLATAGLRSIVRPSGGASGRPSPPRRHPLTVGAAGPEEGLVALPADQGTDVGGTLVAITAPPTAGYIPHLAASAPESVVHRLDLAEQSLAQERSLRGAMQGQLEEQGSRLQEQDEAIDQLVQLASELHTRQRDQSKRISSMMAAAGIAVTATADAGVATGVDTKPGEAWQAQLSQQVLKLEGRLDTLEQQQQHVPPEVSELARRLDALEQQQQQQQQQPPPPPSPQRRQRQQDTTTTTARAPSRSQAAARPTYHQSTWSQRNEQTRSQAARRIQRQFRRYMDEQLAAAEAQLELIEAQRRRRLQQEEEEEEQRQLNALLLQDMQNGAATEVQRWWRGGVARGLRRRLLAQERQRVAVAAAARRSELERERRREEEEEVQAEVELRLLAEAERMLAATDIQRAFRGLLERRRHKQQLAGTATAVAASAQQGSLGGPAGGAGPEGLDPESFATYLDENSFSEQDQARAKALADAARSSASQQAGIGVSWSDDDDEVDEDDVLPPIGPPHIPAQLLNELAESGVELQGVDGGIDWKHQWEQIALERQGHRLQQQPPPPPPHSTAIATRGAAGGYASASVRFATEADATRLISPRDESTGSEYDVLDFSGDDGLLAAAAGDDAGAAAAATLEEHVMATALQAAFRGFAARLAVGRMRRDDGNHADAADDTDDDVQEPQHRQQPPVSGHSSLAGSHATASRQSTTQRRRPTRRPAKGKGRPKLLAPTKSPPTDTEAAKLAAARASQIRAAAATLEQRGSSATGMNSAGAAAAGKVAAVTTRAVDVTVRTAGSLTGVIPMRQRSVCALRVRGEIMGLIITRTD
jgi:hypothetical protein